MSTPLAFSGHFKPLLQSQEDIASSLPAAMAEDYSSFLVDQKMDRKNCEKRGVICRIRHFGKSWHRTHVVCIGITATRSPANRKSIIIFWPQHPTNLVCRNCFTPTKLPTIHLTFQKQTFLGVGEIPEGPTTKNSRERRAYTQSNDGSLPCAESPKEQSIPLLYPISCVSG